MNLITPAGFRDVLPEEALRREALSRAVQDCFAAHGYLPIETPTLEVMDVVQASGRAPASPFKLFDARGDLLALRPDVTLQVARMCASRLNDAAGPLRFRYTQRIFREADGPLQAKAREMTQMGIECVGGWGANIDAEIVSLMAEAMELVGVHDYCIAIATVGVLRAVLEASGAPQAWRAAVLEAYHSSNYVELDALCGPDAPVASALYAEAVCRLRSIRGGREAVEEVRRLIEPLGCPCDIDTFEQTYDALAARGLADRVLVDFSVMSSFDYYTGMVFEVYAPRYGAALGSGGRYDRMIGVYGQNRVAAGFAFYLESVMAAAEQQAREASAADAGAAVSAGAAAGVEGTESESGTASELSDAASAGAAAPAPEALPPLRVAVPKGSLNKDAVAALAGAGLDTANLDHPGRALIIHGRGVDYIIVRPSDAPAFVALGAADCGICGEDSLLEADVDVVKLADLRFGACRFVVAEPAGSDAAIQEHYRRLGSIRVATKYPRITQAHYDESGMQVEIVALHGNIELAPLTGLAERIVDITATGTTLRENDLVIVDEVMRSTARFFANAGSLRTDERVGDLARRLAEFTAAQDYEPIAGAVTPAL